MTFYVAMDIHIEPEVLDEAHTVFADILTVTRDFDGCEGVDVYVDQADPAHWHVLEAWENAERDAAYRAFRATPEGTTRLREFVASPPAAVKYDLDTSF